MRVLIIGNSGSGKSTIAARLSERSGWPVVPLDEIYWQPGGFDKARGPEEQERLLADAIGGPEWIVEGVFGRLIELAVWRATHLVWLDLPWEECRRGIVARPVESGRQSPGLLVWAEQYGEREGKTSRGGHRAFFEAFEEARRWQLGSRVEADSWLEDWSVAFKAP